MFAANAVSQVQALLTACITNNTVFYESHGHDCVRNTAIDGQDHVTVALSVVEMGRLHVRFNWCVTFVEKVVQMSAPFFFFGPFQEVRKVTILQISLTDHSKSQKKKKPS